MVKACAFVVGRCNQKVAVLQLFYLLTVQLPHARLVHLGQLKVGNVAVVLVVRKHDRPVDGVVGKAQSMAKLVQRRPEQADAIFGAAHPVFGRIKVDVAFRRREGVRQLSSGAVECCESE